jgi:signal transduction histidine kinase
MPPALPLSLSCIGLLALALLGIWRSGGSPLGLRLSLLCLSLFSWQLAQLAEALTGGTEWHALNVSISPLSVPLALDFTLAFTGRLRERARTRFACWAGYSVLALLGGPLSLLVPGLRGFGGSPPWAWLYLLGLLLVSAQVAALLLRHLRTASETAERRRASLLLFALLLGALSGATDLFSDVWPQLPSLAPLGLFAASATTALVALRLRLLDHELPLPVGLLALGLGCLGVLVHVWAFRLLGPSAGVLLLGSAALALPVFAATRSLATAAAERRARVSQLALLGRLSAQMAHDLKNPLAALKGAAQFVEEEAARGQGGAGSLRFLRLMIDQIDRLEQVTERYQRLSRVEARLEPLALNALATAVLALQPFAAGPVRVRSELAPLLPDCHGDHALLAAALENLLRNALEAMPEGGTVTVRTGLQHGSLFLSVEDDGPGMDPRTRERAFDDFFTTKAQGSGLGLPFVRRVAEAHAGEVQLLPARPRGTLVRLSLPLPAPRAEGAAA